MGGYDRSCRVQVRRGGFVSWYGWRGTAVVGLRRGYRSWLAGLSDWARRRQRTMRNVFRALVLDQCLDAACGGVKLLRILEDHKEN